MFRGAVFFRTWCSCFGHYNRSYLLTYQKLGSNSTCSTLSKFLVPDKSGTGLHDRLANFLVRDSATSNLDGELGSCVVGLR